MSTGSRNQQTDLWLLKAFIGVRRWLPVLLWLGGCCIEESPGMVTFPNEIELDLERACRLSSHESLHFTAVQALASYLGHLQYRPSAERRCIEYFGSACQFDYPCDKPPDLAGPNPCPPLEAPPPRYYACFGCGVQSKQQPNGLRLNGSELALLERVTRESGARTREEALHRALVYYAQIWLKERQKPDFYQHEYNLPHLRKPDEPCGSQ